MIETLPRRAAVQTIRLLEKTDKDGTLYLRIPLCQPDSEFEIVVVLQPKMPPAATNPYAMMDAIRKALAATGRDFGDSAQDIREDRER
jgi:hypothetical protein